MEVSIRLLGMFGRPKKPIPAAVIKFNRYSLVFNCTKKVKAGDFVYINLKAELHSLREVRARIERCEACGRHFQIRAQFVLERPDKQPYREALSILAALEQAVPDAILSPLHTQ
ncbi:MAG: hypothetical protein RPT11_08620 [Bermanella sp.]